MKLAVSASYYEKRYGLEAGLKYLKDKGYESIVYMLPRYEEYARKNMSEEKFETYFKNIRATIERSGLSLAFTTNTTGIYSDMVPSTYEARIDMCMKGVKATALLGCEVFAVRPVKFYWLEDNKTEMSRKLAYDALKRIKAEADKYGVKLAIVNADNDEVFGWCVEDIKELVDEFDMYVVIDTEDGFFAGSKVKDFVSAFNDRLIGVLLKDVEATMKNPMIPFMGKAGFQSIAKSLAQANTNAAAVVMPEMFYARLQEFQESNGLWDALDELYYEIGCVMAGKENV